MNKGMWFVVLKIAELVGLVVVLYLCHIVGDVMLVENTPTTIKVLFGLLLVGSGFAVVMLLCLLCFVLTPKWWNANKRWAERLASKYGEKGGRG